jgi:hypothetical protein
MVCISTVARIKQLYSACDIPLINIKIHLENGGPEEDYGYIHLGVPVGSETYQLNHLDSLVDKFTKACECDEIGKHNQSGYTITSSAKNFLSGSDT